MPVCDKCSKEFARGGGFAKHHASCKGRAETAPAPVPETVAAAPVVPNDVVELSAKSNVNPLQCAECGKVLSSASNVNRHMRSHQNSKRMKTDQNEHEASTLDTSGQETSGESSPENVDNVGKSEDIDGSESNQKSVESPSEGSEFSSASGTQDLKKADEPGPEQEKQDSVSAGKAELQKCVLCGSSRTAEAMEEHIIYCKWKQQFWQEYNQETRVPR